MLGWFKEDNRLAAVMFDDLGWETITRVSGGGIVKFQTDRAASLAGG